MDINRYLINFNTKEALQEETEVLVFGNGVSALYAALVIAEKKKVILLTNGRSLQSVLSVYAEESFDIDKQDVDTCVKDIDFKDTLYGGRGLTDEQSIVSFMDNVDSNRERLQKMLNVPDFTGGRDKYFGEQESETAIYYEWVKSGMKQKLAALVENNANIKVINDYFATDMITNDNKCCGLVTKSINSDTIKIFKFQYLLLAQEGHRGIYDSEGVEGSRGESAAMYLRAGGELADMEFVHFWSLVVENEKRERIIVPYRFLQIGPIMRNSEGERFLEKYEDLAEMAPGNQIGRAIFKECQSLKTNKVYLDITFKDRAYLERTYKALYSKCLKIGIDISQEFMPISPMVGYCIGGIKTEANGKTKFDNVYACGETACNFFFGARLTRRNIVSNSIVFTGIAADEIAKAEKIDNIDVPDVKCDMARGIPCKDAVIETGLRAIHEANNNGAGIVKNQKSLYDALRVVMKVKEQTSGCENKTIDSLVLQNELLISEVMIMSSIERRESRGSHYRTDYADVNNQKWRRHIIRRIF